MSIQNDPGTKRNRVPFHSSGPAEKSMALLRVATGLLFLWAFFDKLFGLGYATPAAKAWLGGGSPTAGFLGRVDVGPFREPLRAIAGAWWVDWLFMLGLAGIGVAVLFGAGLRLAAVAGTVMMLLMWVAEWPLAQVSASGAPSGSTNPLIDYHVIYALVLIALAATHAGNTWGLGRTWESRQVVRRHGWLA
ncbi:DoxX family membrane protein [Allokutzneria sp. NRRL B-24872]|uniref:DoxX family membrane protein n=1 Tax=Allokutzneria sp. NRRL B-24872 TaxID=1137961 RepID=UPI000A380224|nr:DoxX family membrane protein [Allokutzneria sp. NRRL B-24872]